jgi:hypothetical protein
MERTSVRNRAITRIRVIERISKKSIKICCSKVSTKACIKLKLANNMTDFREQSYPAVFIVEKIINSKMVSTKASMGSL